MHGRSFISYAAIALSHVGLLSSAAEQSELDVQPRLIHRPKVEFPKSQQLKGVYSARVVLLVDVSSEGTVSVVETIDSPHEDFTKMATEFATRSRFSPPMKNGRPVNARLKWPLLLGTAKSPSRVPPPTGALARELVADQLSTQAAIDTHPHLVSQPAANFSANLLARRLPASSVVLDVTVDRKGSVTVLNVVESHHEELAKVATGFATGCRFTPPLKNGGPVETRFKWPIHFRP